MGTSALARPCGASQSLIFSDFTCRLDVTNLDLPALVPKPVTNPGVVSRPLITQLLTVPRGSGSTAEGATRLPRNAKSHPGCTVAQVGNFLCVTICANGYCVASRAIIATIRLHHQTCEHHARKTLHIRGFAWRLLDPRMSSVSVVQGRVSPNAHERCGLYRRFASSGHFASNTSRGFQ